MQIKYTINTNNFLGHEVSDYGIKNHRVDYLTLSKTLDCELNNEIINTTNDWIRVHGNPEDRLNEVIQYYVVSDSGAQVLQNLTNETVLYSDNLDVYLWCIFHYGTSWDYVLTDIAIDTSLSNCTYEEVYDDSIFF